MGIPPAGTDFPPNNGDYCANGTCYGDAFGLYRNPSEAHCFSQHPHGNTPRPVAGAFKLLAEIFGTQPFAPQSLHGLNEDITMVVFQRTNSERIIVLWNNTGAPLTHSFQAIGAGGRLYYLNGETLDLLAVGGRYTLALKPARDFTYPDLDSARQSAIGGEPVILVESPSG